MNTKTYLILFALAFCNAILAQKMQVIYLINDRDPIIVTGVNKDKEIIESLLRQICEQISYEYSESVFNNKHKPEHLMSAIDQLNCDAKDIIFFYYSGHGYRKKEQLSEFPYILWNYSVSADDVLLEDIHNLLKKKEAQLLVSIGDQCNEQAASMSRSFNLSPPLKSMNTVADAIKDQMFRKIKGDIIIASAKAGEVAEIYNEVGSVFTLAFADAFSKALVYNEQLDWPGLLSSTQQLVDLQCSPTHRQNLIYTANISNLDSLPEPNTPPIHFTEFNQKINEMADESKPGAERVKLIDELTKYAHPECQVEVYIDNVLVEKRAFKKYLQKIYLNPEPIDRINLIEKKCTTNEEKKYNLVALHTIWTLKNTK